MKKHLLLLLAISLVTHHSALAQDPPPAIPSARETNSLPRFDFDFAGGPPNDLVNAIKAMGKPLNAIIPDNCGAVRIPRFSVKNVTVPELFAAVGTASQETISFANRGSLVISSYGFRTEGTPNENSIWCFYRDKLADSSAPMACHFYQLSPFLEAGYKVEDITTAIETAWKMLGIATPPEIKYHKDTKLLIAVGEEEKLKMIEDALSKLSKAPLEKSKAP